MDIHIAVRDIVDQVGTSVLSDPDNFRGVLDDVLDEDAADAGEVNLLVDAVRFGAVAQLVRLLDSDADMVRAVETAASGFARLRGGADPNASRWACAVLGFAIRRVPEGLVIDLASRLPSRRDTVQPAPAHPAHPDPVPPPPAPGQTRPLSVPPPPAVASVPPPPTHGQPVVASPYAAPTGSPRGSAAKIIAVVGLVLAIVAAGYLGWRFFWPRGGAGSPEEAVEQLMEAAADQDPVALLDVVTPAEVEDLDDVYDTALDRAKDEDLVDDDDSIVDAFDLEFSDLEFEVDEQGDDLARVTLVDGGYDVSWDPADLPDRLDFVAETTGKKSDSGDIQALFDDEQPALTTVKIDGRWYVTLLGTAASYLFDGLESAAVADGVDLDEPDYDLASVDADPITGDDPEEVIGNLVDALNSGDVGDLLANLPEDFVKPLLPYIPVFESANEQDGDQAAIGFEVGAEGLDLDTEDLDDGRLKVTVAAGSFSGTYLEYGTELSSGSIKIDGDCVETYSEVAVDSSGCLSDEEILVDLGLDEIFFVLSEVDDGYQFDPGATLVEYAETVVDGLSGDVVDQLIEEIENEV